MDEIEMMTLKSAELLISNKIIEADNMYNKIDEILATLPEEKYSEGLRYMLTVFALVIDSEDARFKIKKLKSGAIKFAWQVRVFKKWYFYPLLILLDLNSYLTRDVLSLSICKLKYKTPVYFLLK